MIVYFVKYEILPIFGPMRRSFIPIIACFAFFCNTYTIYGSAPTRLTTDLIEHTDRVWIDGTLSQLSVDYPGKVIERAQFAAIASTHPRFGWQVNDQRNDVMQTAWRIQLATSRQALEADSADMWDSGQQSGNNSTSVPYGGKELKPATLYYWRVMTWNNEEPQEWSAIRVFKTADSLSEYQCAYYPTEKSDQNQPVSSNILSENLLFADFGLAAFGQLRITVSAEQEDTLTVRLGECLKEGRIDPAPGGSRRFLSQQIPLLPGRHTYYIKIPADSRNTGQYAVLMPDYIGEVYPFRYCEIEGKTVKEGAISVSRQAVHYPFNDFATTFTCSDTTLQQVWDLCKYSIKATSFAGLYVDGDRERIGYEGDVIINQLAHYATDREFSLARKSHEYMLTHATWPTEWILQSVVSAWQDYLYTGDERSLSKYYEILKNKTLPSMVEENGFLKITKEKQTPEFLASVHLFYGGTVQNLVDWPGGERDGYVMADINTAVNAYYYRALSLMAKIAGIIGETEDAASYSAQAAALAKNFNKELFNKKTGTYCDGIGTDHQSLHANMYPLAFGLVPEKEQETVVDFIRSRGMACSVYGAQFLLDALYDAEAADHALGLLTSDTERSWYNMIRVGSTISLEAWDNKFKPNQDWNHPWGAAPANIIPRKLMGIEPLEAGFAKMRIKPQPASLREASLIMPTIRGNVEVSFENTPDRFILRTSTPANTRADIYLPLDAKIKRYELTQNGAPVTHAIREGNFIKIPDTGSGSKEFVLIPSK